MTALEEYAEHFRGRVLQDALGEATGSYWRRRARTFDGVGTPHAAEIAEACRNRARISLVLDDDGEDRRCCIATPEELADLDRLARAFRNLSELLDVSA